MTNTATATRLPQASAAHRRFRLALGLPLRLVTLVLAWVSLGAAAAAQSPVDLPFQRLGIAHGLPSAATQALAQDSQGFLWIGTQHGLVRYDGIDFIRYGQREGMPSLGDDYVTRLLAAGDGTLWIGTRNGGVHELLPDRSDIRHYTASDGLADDEIYALHLDARGRLWVGSRTGLAVLDHASRRFRAYRIDQGASMAVEAIADGEHGDLWLGTTRGLRRFDTRAAMAQDLPPDLRSLSDRRITVLRRDHAGRLLIGTAERGIYRYAGAGRLEHWSQQQLQMPQQQPSVQSLLEDRRGDLWIGSEFDGLRRVFASDGSVAAYRYDGWSSNGLAENDIAALLQDRTGRLWIATGNSGLNTLDLHAEGIGQISHKPGNPQSLAGKKVAAIAGNQRGTIWFASSTGGLTRLDEGSGAVSHLRHRVGDPDSLASDTVNALAIAADGTLWAGTPAALDRIEFDPQGTPRFEHIRLDTDSAVIDQDNRVQSLLPEANGDIWIGSRRQGLLHYRSSDRTITRIALGADDSQAVDYPMVRALHRDRHGRLWVGTSGGGLYLQLPDGVHFARFRNDPADPSSLSNNRISSIYEDSDGAMWVGTSSGLNKVALVEHHDGLRLDCERFGSREGLVSDAIGAVLEARPNELWVSTAAGLSRLDPARRRARNFTVRSGALPDYFVGSAHRSRSGRLYFGGSDGVTVLRPEQIGEPSAEPLLAITQASIDQQALDRAQLGALSAALTGGRPFTLDYRSNSLSLGFAALDFIEPQYHRYRFRLHGYDRDWHTLDGRRSYASYSRLPAGRYRFEAQVADALGGWNDQALNLAIVVSPSPWLSNLAFAGYASVLLAACGYWLQLRRRRQRAERQHNETLRLGAERLRLALSGADSGIWDVDLQTGATYRAGLTCLGEDIGTWSADGGGMRAHMHPDDQPAFLDAKQKLFSGEHSWIEIDYRLRHTDGHWLWVHDRGQVVTRDPLSGRAVRASGILTNIQAQKEAEDRLRELANFDALTHLANRHSFQELLADCLVRAESERHELALLFIDLDRFKHINDAMGHQFGDKVLTEVARRLRELLPDNGDGARIGGDEFTVILWGDDIAVQAQQFAQQFIDRFRHPLQIGLAEVVCTPSIGIALLPSQAHDADELIRYADTAMYHAKADGRNRYRVYNDAMARQIVRRLELERALTRAVENREFYLQFQPKRDMLGGEVHSAEVLLRWHSPEFGEVSPTEFVPILEDCGLIDEVGLWVLDEACRRYIGWVDEGLPPLRLAINVSMRQIADGDFIHRVTSLLGVHRVPAADIELEFTESVVMNQSAPIIEVMRHLKNLGLSLSIDDFGTGFSNFSYLIQLPIDKIKLDKSIVDPIAYNEDAATVCAAMIAMAHTLHLKVVAEGVETPEQRALLTQCRCDEEQGYLFSRPLSAEDTTAFIRRVLRQSGSAGRVRHLNAV